MFRLLSLWTGALTLLLGALAPASSVAQPSSSTTTLSDTVAFDRSGTVEIDNQNGSITVTTWNRAQVGYEMTLEPSEGDSVFVPEAYVHRTDREMSFGEGDSWSFQIPGFLSISPSGTSSPGGHYRVVMPKTAELEIDDYTSTIDVSGLTADVEIDTHQGEATVDSVKGHLQLETHTGTIEATAIRGGVELDTHSGSISVSFEQLSSASSAESHSGPLHFFLPTDAGFELALDLGTADLTIDEAFGTPSGDSEHRIFNGGGPELEIDSFSGTVDVRPSAQR